MRTFMFLLAGLICFCCCIPPPASADDKCAQWRVPQDWDLAQDNGFNLNLKTRQDKNQHLRGEAVSWNQTMSGSVDGQVSGDKLTFAIYWQNNAVGDYNGTIDSAGHVEGFTQDRNDKGSTAGFYGSTLLNCAKWVQSSPPPEAPQESSGPQPSPDAIMHKSHEQAGTSPPGGDGVLVPEPSSGPSPFGPPPTPEEKLGITEKQSGPQGGVGKVLPKSVSPEEKLGITEKPGTGVGDILEDMNPDAH